MEREKQQQSRLKCKAGTFLPFRRVLVTIHFVISRRFCEKKRAIVAQAESS
jgi:hypothetical protein